MGSPSMAQGSEFFWFPLSFQKINVGKSLTLVNKQPNQPSLNTHKWAQLLRAAPPLIVWIALKTSSICIFIIPPKKGFFPLTVALWIIASAFHARRVPFKRCQDVVTGWKAAPFGKCVNHFLRHRILRAELPETFLSQMFQLRWQTPKTSKKGKFKKSKK